MSPSTGRGGSERIGTAGVVLSPPNKSYVVSSSESIRNRSHLCLPPRIMFNIFCGIAFCAEGCLPRNIGAATKIELACVKCNESAPIDQ